MNRLQTENDFLHAFQRRHEYARVLLELSHEQKQCLEQTNTQGLLEVLSRKQRVLNEYESLRAKEPELAKQWKAIRNSTSNKTRLLCEQFLEQTETMFSELMHSEKQCTEQLTEQKNKTEQQLRKVTAGAAAHHSYHEETIITSPQHLDINH